MASFVSGRMSRHQSLKVWYQDFIAGRQRIAGLEMEPFRGWLLPGKRHRAARRAVYWPHEGPVSLPTGNDPAGGPPAGGDPAAGSFHPFSGAEDGGGQLHLPEG